MSSSSILEFLRQVEENELDLHSFMIVRNGHVTAEGTWAPYRADVPHVLNSLSKSFTSTAIGFAAEEGRLSLDDRVISYFPDEVTAEIADNMKDLAIRHLLSMSTGHTVDTIPIMTAREDGDWVRAFLETPIERPPGTHFLYNTGATYMLSVILYKATGEQLLDYLQPRLFAPLGIADVRTRTCPRGIHVGGFGMHMKIEDIAKLGQLYLQEGVWEGKRLLSGEWVRMAVSKQVDNGDDPSSDWAQGYGFQFWMCRHGAYRGDGAFGQFCIVIPRKQAVIAITAGSKDMQGIMNAVWDKLLPGMHDSPIEHPDAAAQEELAARLRELAYPAPAAERTTDASKWSNRTYRLGDDRNFIHSFRFRFGEDEAELDLEMGGVMQRLRIGHGVWADNTVQFGEESALICASGRWISSDQYEVELRYMDFAFHDRLACHFTDDELRIEVSRNVGFQAGLSNYIFQPTMVAKIDRERDGQG